MYQDGSLRWPLQRKGIRGHAKELANFASGSEKEAAVGPIERTSVQGRYR